MSMQVLIAAGAQIHTQDENGQKALSCAVKRRVIERSQHSEEM